MLVIAGCVVACLIVGMGSIPLMDPDEGRNAEVAREMAQSNDYVLPRLNALPYLDKPVLYFAAAAATMELIGPGEFAARLPALLFALATAGLLWWFGDRIYGAGTGALAALIFLSAPLAMAFARIVIFDTAVTFFVTLAVMTFYLALERKSQGQDRWLPLSVIAWISIALGVLTKGPVALLLPLVVALPFAIRRRALRAVCNLTGLLVFAAIVMPWVMAVSARRPDFLHYVLVTETISRVTTNELRRSAPFWFLIPVLVGGSLPWSIAAMGSAGGVERRERGHQRLLCFVWILLPLLLFSLSTSKRPQYVLPLVVPVALLAADVWMRSPIRRRIAVIMAAFIAGMGAVFILAAVTGLGTAKMDPPLRHSFTVAAWRIGVVWIAAGASAMLLRERRWACAVSLSAPMLLLTLLALPVFEAMGTTRSARELVSHLPAEVRLRGRVVSVGIFHPSMSFYLGRPLFVVSDDGSDIRSNYLPLHYEEFSTAPSSTLRPMSWMKNELASCSPGEIFVLRRKDAASSQLPGLPLLASDSRLMVFGPCPAAGRSTP